MRTTFDMADDAATEVDGLRRRLKVDVGAISELSRP